MSVGPGIRNSFDVTGATGRFVRSAVGVYRTSSPQRIAASQIAAYAEAIGAPARDSAPPLFVVVPAWQAARAAVRDFDLAASREDVSEMGLHESQDMTMTRALRAGDFVRTRSAVVGMRTSSLGTKALVRTETVDDAEAVLAVQYSSTFFFGASGRYECGELVPPGRAFARRPARSPDAVRTRYISRDVALAYAAASNDRSAIHTDDAAARRGGLPGIIVHGMCLFALVCEQYRALAGGECAAEIASVRFARPALPGMTMVSHFWHVADRTVAFEADADDGLPLLRRGYLRLRG